MRIILKPLGAGLVVTAFLVVLGLLWRQSSHKDAVAQPVDAVAAPTLTATGTGSAEAANRLSNPGFEEDYRQAHPYDNKAVLNGTTPEPWRDDSSWARVHVTYAPDKVRPHSGAHCLKVNVSSVEHIGTDLDTVQLIQELMLEPQKYRVGVWVRADRPVPLTLMARQAAEPFAPYGTSTATVGKEWRHLTADADVTEDGKVFIMVNVAVAATVWIDDATLIPVQP